MKTVTTLAILFTVFSANMVFAQQMENKESTKSPTMKIYLIERDIPNAGTLTQSDLKGASQKSCEVLKELGNGIEWLNSYVVDDKFYCVYRAENKELIKTHANKGGFPCNKIMEIKSNISPATASINVH